MEIASLTDLIPVDYRQAFPDHLFPATGPDDEFLSENGYAKVNRFIPHDPRTQKLIPAQPYFDDPWVFVVRVVDKTEGEIAETLADERARALRDAKMLRAAEVEALVVTTTSGKTFDGNEPAQDRMVRAIQSMGATDTKTWVLAGNLRATVTRDELQEALRLATLATDEIWVRPYLQNSI